MPAAPSAVPGAAAANPAPQPAVPPQAAGQNYTQINVMFPASQVEMPDASKFNAFPEEAQRAILTAFRAEQIERHNWLKRQQENEHALNIGSQSWNGRIQLAGLLAAVVIISIILIGGIYLLKAGASAAGIATMLTALAALIGTAVYGHRAKQPKGK